MGLQEVAAVDQGGRGPHQLNRRDLKGLAPGGGDQVGVVAGLGKLLVGEEDALGLAGEVDAGLFPKTEGLKVFVEGLRADFQAHVGEGDVAGIAQCLHGGLTAVAGGLPAADNLVAAFKLIRAGALIGVVAGDGPGVQARGQGDRLEGGAGLIAVGDAAVAPLPEPGGGHGGIVGRHAVGIGLGSLPGPERRLVLVLQLLPEVLVVDLLPVVGVVAAQGGHAENFAGIHIHDHAERAVENVVLLDGLLQVLLQVILDGHIQGQHQGIAVRGVVILFISIEHLRAAVALGGDDRAGVAGEGGFVIGLQALAAHILQVDEAQNLGCQRAVGVVPPGVQLQVDDAAEVVLGDKVPDLLGGLLRHLPLDHLVIIGRVGGLLLDEVGLHVQQIRQALGDKVHRDGGVIFLARLALFGLLLDAAGQRIGVQENRLHRGVGGQNVHIPVVDHPSGGGQHGTAGLVIDGPLLVLVVIHDHQLVERGNQGDKQPDSAHQHHHQRAAQNQAVGPLGGVAGLAVSALYQTELSSLRHEVDPFWNIVLGSGGSAGCMYCLTWYYTILCRTLQQNNKIAGRLCRPAQTAEKPR